MSDIWSASLRLHTQKKSSDNIDNHEKVGTITVFVGERTEVHIALERVRCRVVGVLRPSADHLHDSCSLHGRDHQHTRTSQKVHQNQMVQISFDGRFGDDRRTRPGGRHHIRPLLHDRFVHIQDKGGTQREWIFLVTHSNDHHLWCRTHRHGAGLGTFTNQSQGCRV